MNKALKQLQFRVMRGTFALVSRVAPNATGRYLARRFVTPEAAGRSLAVEALVHADDVQRDTIPIPGEDIATYVWGDLNRSPYVLIGHGWSSYALRFGGWIPRLRAAGYAVVAFDQAAHGLSSGRVSSLAHFIEVTRQVGRHYGRPAAFVGHSLGASAMAFAEEPDWRPERFVLIAPLAVPLEGAWRIFRSLDVAPSAFPAFEAWLSDICGGARFVDFHAERRVQDIDRPALIIHDRHDRETPWEEGALYARLWPGARLLTTEGLGHNRLVDHPSVIDEAVAFLGRANSA